MKQAELANTVEVDKHGRIKRMENNMEAKALTKEEIKQEKKEIKQEKKEAKKEAKQEKKEAK